MKTENQLKIALTALIVLAVVFLGGKAVFAVSDSPAEDIIKVSLANHLEKHPDNQLALLLAQLLLGEQAKEEPQAGLAYQSGTDAPFERTCYKDSNNPYRAVCEGWEEIDIPSTADATSTAKEFNFLGNTVGTDVFVDYVEAEVKGTVSSTFSLYAGVTSTPSINPNSGNGRRPDNLIDGARFTTSTASIQSAANYRNTRNSIKDAGTNGINTARMGSSDYFAIFLQAEQGSGNCFNASACEPVTSTNRGFTGKVRYHWHYLKDL